MRALTRYLRRLTDAYGVRFVATVIFEYGLNQGVGLKMVGVAKSYYLLDTLGLTSATLGQLNGFAHIPWQLKSIFGLLSDTVAIAGRHRGPYLFFAGAVGAASCALLAANAPAWFNGPGDQISVVGIGIMALLSLGVNFNVAMADVMIDAAVAEKCKAHPSLASDLQSLCWGSLGTLGIPAAVMSGYLLSLFGPRLLFGLAVLSATSIAVPALFNWLGERRKESALRAIDRWRQMMQEKTKRLVALAALLVGVYSISLGVLQLTMGRIAPNFMATFTIVGNFALCTSLWWLLSHVDVTLGRAVMFPFLQGALCPSSSILFEWSHDVAGGGDTRCYTSAQCVNASLDVSTIYGTGKLPCGWALARGYPCISPMVFSWVSVAGSMALVAGTTLYNTHFQSWSYRRIIATTGVALGLVNLLDLLWVSRLNLRLGVPDVAFLFGDEVLADIVERLNSMPFYIYAAKLCPPSVEGSMFALFMGLSNFGFAAGQYLGSGVLKMFGGVEAPEYEYLASYVAVKSVMRFLPVALVPFLVPPGCPADTAAEMEARKPPTPIRPHHTSDITPCMRAEKELDHGV